MPGISGREVAERVASKRREAKVLYMSGYADSAVLLQGAIGERVPFLQEPFTPETLARKVREILDAAARRSSS